MTWNETDQKGVFARPIGENETFIKLIGDAGQALSREHWSINSTATVVPTGLLQSIDLATHFRKAWIHVRFQHPSLAPEVASDNLRLIYTVPVDDAAIYSWADETFTVDTDAKSSADVIPTFHPTPSAKLVYIPQSGELLGHTAHWRTDGIGVLLLLDAFLSIAASPDLSNPASLPWGTESARLAPSVEDAANMPQSPTPEQQALAATLTGTFAHAAGATGSRASVTQSPSRQARAPRR